MLTDGQRTDGRHIRKHNAFVAYWRGSHKNTKKWNVTPCRNFSKQWHLANTNKTLRRYRGAPEAHSPDTNYTGLSKPGWCRSLCRVRVRRPTCTAMPEIRLAELFNSTDQPESRGHPYKLFKRQCACTVRSSFFYGTRRIIIWNYLPSDTVDFSSLSLHLSIQLNVSISVIFSTSHSCFAYWYREFYVCSTCFFLNFILIIGRLLALYFSLVVPAICYLFFMHVVCWCALCVVCVLGK